MNFVVCDDNKEFADYLTTYLSEIEPNSITKVFYSAEKLIFNMPELSSYIDAIFLDIKLQNQCGIDVATKILHDYPNIKIVYITGYPDDYSQAIFNCPPEIVPTAFLVKPIKKEYLLNAIKRIKDLDLYTKNNKRFVCIKQQYNKKVLISTDKIIYVSVQGRKLSIYTLDSKIEIYSKLSDFMKLLPKNFVQCHKSYCVNLQYVKNINGWKELILTNGISITISRSFMEKFKKSVTEMYSVIPD